MAGKVMRVLASQQFNYVKDGQVLGYLKYAMKPSNAAMDLQSTVVNPAGRGAGIAGKLCDAAFETASKEGLKIIPTCSYIETTYLTKNPHQRKFVL